MRRIVLCDSGEPEKVLPLCEKHVLGIEIQGFYHPNETDKRNERMAMYQSLLPHGIERYLHAPFWDLCLGSANNRIADVTRFYFDYAYEIGEELGCLGMTVHHGFVPHTSYPTSWIKRGVAFWNDFYASHSGVMNVYMENLCEQDPSTLAGIVDGCQNSRLSINLDIGHAHCNNPMPVLDWIKQLGRRIAYVHLHQNDGSRDAHWGLKKGNIPLEEVLPALCEYAPDAVWAIECNTDEMEESIEFLREKEYLPISNI